ncbi:MAG: hypothetical protein ACE5Z5_09670 [Candidatus Bathyarchaeia archaeon]
MEPLPLRSGIGHRDLAPSVILKELKRVRETLSSTALGDIINLFHIYM